ncbi:5,6-dimethylbenzimidazole synthase [Hyphomicrobium sp.]|uniref:5,6-dimethylbenzimidazole synthase n=1 Tax=Hyphomicrobium sp. TaxID=82 RepID=UPI002E375290|nr:5,6-dimethylbenzimidazole synthase [Hyphomicrobium sp.]HEX2841026.1 5,6-dimethylbenzimidazole synthase [Hyphomicrobium sp.]
MTDTRETSPDFGPGFVAAFRDLVLWRRDVRRFRTDPLPDGLVERLIDLACHAPSVGNCQPWRFALVDAPERRVAVRDSFRRANQSALEGYDGESRALYARLKLEGLEAAPVQLAVFADETTERGAGLGRQTMPETLRYSVVGAIHTLWLAARAEGVGLGWISILEPDVVTKALDVPDNWRLVAYLCLGYPVEEHLDPELERAGWQSRAQHVDFILRR